jgi:SAM-dependent methyltransferase
VCDDGERYPVLNGIPDLVVDDGRTALRVDRLARLAELEGRHFWFAGRAALVGELLRATLLEPATVLDAGCGNGRLLAALAADGHRAIGVDLLADGLDRARRWAPGACVARASVDRLPFADMAFDAVVLLDVLEHVDDRAALAEVRRVLRRRGALIVSVPAGPWLWSYRDEDAGHLRRYSRAGLRGLLADEGFGVERLRSYQALLLPVLAVARLRGRRSPALRDLEERPPPLVNGALGRVTSAELALGRVLPLPWGSSIVAMAGKR